MEGAIDWTAKPPDLIQLEFSMCWYGKNYVIPVLLQSPSDIIKRT